MADISIVGRKTFFITSKAKSIPESYLVELLSSGYEAYIVEDDGAYPLRQKVQRLIAAYPGAVLLFCTDSPGIDWHTHIEELQKMQGLDALLGVLQSGTQRQPDAPALYGRLPFGCIQPGAEGLERLKQLLARYGANGRRSMVRANCGAGSTFVFEYKGKMYTERVLDVNRSYFACDFALDSASPVLYEKIHGTKVTINGLELHSGAVLIMKSLRRGVNLHIFMFIRPDGTPELDDAQRERLNRKIYEIVAGNGKQQLSKVLGLADIIG